ncbi:MAG TPA: glycosyltransferase family 39 protein [Candidatus Saccharimonadales bacterium]|nr:glycosyltransferase family 39 protein [Candidatus Saccharimonadales bacterium]
MFKAQNRWTARLTWRGLLIAAVVAVTGFFIFFWRLSSLTPGLSPGEIAARQSGASLHDITHNPINAPYKLLQLALTKLGSTSTFELRLASVIFGIFFLWCFYKLAVNWFGRFIGLAGAILFVTLPFFAVSVRQASAEIMYFVPIALMWLYVWLLKTPKRQSLAWFLLLMAAAVSLYTPGMVWWIAASFAISKKRITSATAQVPAWISAAGLLLVAAAAGSLAVAGAHTHTVAKQLLLIPSGTLTVITTLKNLGWMALSLFVKTGSHNPLILGRSPVLDILMLALLVFGVYAMQSAARVKAIALGLSILFAVAAAGINDNFALLALGLPAVCVFTAAGLRYLYIEWRSIFPRNPVPKTFALALIAALTLSQVYFGLRYALVAWPHSPATRTVYVLK